MMIKIYKMSLVACLLTVLGLAQADAQTVRYVKPAATGTGDGLSWVNAAGDIQDVINTAVAGDKIFVAAGTYVPNRPANTPLVPNAASRDNAFVLKDGVSVYGGFAGTEANETERVAGNETILSGDLGRNTPELTDDDIYTVDDTTTPNVITVTLSQNIDNCHHVVIAQAIADPNTKFDGFTIVGGYGELNSNLSLTANSVTININRRLGAGMYIIGTSSVSSALSVSNTVFKFNQAFGDASAKTGAGVLVDSYAIPTITKCVVYGNLGMSTGTPYGTGISVAGTDPTTGTVLIQDTEFKGNVATFGALALNNRKIEVLRCIFDRNKVSQAANRGGAIDIRSGSNTLINKCTFLNNSAAASGGAIAVFSGVPTVKNSYFEGNTAANGGAVHIYNGRASFINNIFYNNSTGGQGAAIQAQGVSGGNGFHGVEVINNTFYSNKNTRATPSGYTAALHLPNPHGIEGIYTDNISYVYNNVFFNNTFPNGLGATTPDILVTTAANVVIFNNIVQQTANIPAEQNNQTNVDPLFISTIPGDRTFLAPSKLSPAYDAGDNSYNTETTDFNGNGRKNGVIDMGAVEFHNVLPVALSSFTAKAENSIAKLNWSTQSERDNKEFIISRSTNANTFTELKRVAGAGTSNQEIKYQFLDNAPLSGINYYKLTQVDFDGTIKELGVKSLRFGLSASTITVSPNPTKDKATLAITAGAYTKYSIIGIQGNIVTHGTIGNTDTQIEINLTSVAAGTYIIKLTGASGNTATRVIKF